MLNLSDKELDHFSKEAAQEYEPGDVLGERSWERLEIRLDRDLGRVHLNPLRHIRRFPFYYAPAMLVLLGVSYYLVRRSGSPPLRAVKAPAAVVQNPSSSQSPVYKENSTLRSSTATPTLPAEKADGTPVGGGEGVAAGTDATGTDATGTKAAGTDAAGTGGARSAGTAKAAGSAGDTPAVGSAGTPPAAGSAGAGSGTNAAVGAGSTVNAAAGTRGGDHRRRNGRANQEGNTLAITAPANAGRGINGKNANGKANANHAAGDEAGGAGTAGIGDNSGGTGGVSGTAAGGNSQAAAPAKELGRVALQGLRPLKKAAHVSDSALRAFTLKSTAPQLIRKSGVHINRSLEFGVLAAPDFASVNALAGDRPGSTIGLTIDYEFANHWYIGSGLLLDRKIFSAYAQDFHAPPNFYADNGMRGDVYLVKGAFEMLEVPLNLRYDFAISGSTFFFFSGGLSSYLLASQNNNYYYHMTWNPRSNECMPVSSPDKSYLFSALNLSMGVETGLSNSLSLLVAPYVKVPVRGIGVGQVQMSTVGINFSLRFAPVISRKRY